MTGRRAILIYAALAILGSWFLAYVIIASIWQAQAHEREAARVKMEEYVTRTTELRARQIERTLRAIRTDDYRAAALLLHNLADDAVTNENGNDAAAAFMEAMREIAAQAVESENP